MERATYTMALKGSGKVPSRLSFIKQLSNNTDVEWLFPEPWEMTSEKINFVPRASHSPVRHRPVH